MTKNHYFLIAVFLGAGLLAFLLTYKGCNSSKAERGDTAQPALDHTDHSEKLPEVSVDEQIDLALANIEKGRETNDFELMMTQGVRKLQAIEAQDSNNERVLYHLGLLSLESMQLEKAEIRFKKLILLQPSNEEYQKLYDEVVHMMKEN